MSSSTDTRPYKEIGAGGCGAIYAQDGKPLALKLAKADDSDLWNDYSMHTLILENVKHYDIEIRVPECYCFVPKDDMTYFENNQALVIAAQNFSNFPTNILATERILPLPEITRTRLIEKYCAERIKPIALVDPANRDCLVRVYLGSLQGKSGGTFFSLRNFKLHFNHMIDLQLDVEEMASQIAEALAVMHWAARTDARDVEFVLGSSPEKLPLSTKSHAEILKMRPGTYTGPVTRDHEDFFHRQTELWLLDFNQVRAITMDEAGVAQAVQAAMTNDPYFPRPLQENADAKRVWNQFEQSYLDMADEILSEQDPTLQELPRLFIQQFAELQRKKQETAVNSE
ncbi:zinc finger protein-domain-containing protein [Hypoxylon crocopeplum]|nr:zinc finger protein-domain-containing protein [Hypoxylon crocopeplum]